MTALGDVIRIDTRSTPTTPTPGPGGLSPGTGPPTQTGSEHAWA